MRSDQHALPAPRRQTEAHKAGAKAGARLARIGRLPISNTDPMLVVLKSREHTVDAVMKLVDLMNGKLPDSNSGDLNGVPPAVQLRAAELLIERGYGKAPQAILLRDDTGTNAGSVHAIPIMERIAQLKAARESQGSVTDLEASELTVVDETHTSDLIRVESPVTSNPIQVKPEDII